MCLKSKEEKKIMRGKPDTIYPHTTSYRLIQNVLIQKFIWKNYIIFLLMEFLLKIIKSKKKFSIFYFSKTGYKNSNKA